MSTLVKLKVCRRLDNRLEGLDDKSPRAADLHRMRSRALHDMLDDDPTWSVNDWGEADDTQPHEWVELWLHFQEQAANLAPLAVPALAYVGKVLLDTAIGTLTVEAVKHLLNKAREKQKAGQLRDVDIQLLNETTISLHPDSDEITVTLRTVASVPYDVPPDKLAAIEARSMDAKEPIEVPTALVPFVNQLISRHRMN